MPTILAAQAGTISGKVVHEGTGAGVPAVQVSIPALKVSTLTAADGSFTLAGVRPGNYELHIIRIGFRATDVPVEVRAGQILTPEVKITEAAMALDEIVVTGTAGQARRREVGNSISQVQISDVKQPVQNLDQMLQGRTAGVVIPTGRADMGSGSAIRLRGNASLSLTSYPLIYVDGIRQTAEAYSSNNLVPNANTGTRQGGQASLLADIDPATIDRVEIVKGPAATALYGTEAAAGVIQIFTKKGVTGRTVWTFQTDQGVRAVRPWGSQPGTYYGSPGRPAGIPLPSSPGSAAIAAGTPTQACIRLADQPLIDAGLADGLAISGCHRPYHDMDPYLHKPWRQRYTLSVAGGSDAVRYFTSASGEGGDGILPLDNDLRYQFRSNVSFHPTEKLNIDISSAYSRYKYSFTGSNNGTSSLYFQVVRRPLNGPSSYDYRILDSILTQRNNVRNDRMILGATATWTPLSGMTHKLTLGYDDARSEENYLLPFNYITDRPGRISLEKSGSRSFSTDYVLSQQISLFTGLKSTLSAGGQLVQRDEDALALEGAGLPGPGEHTVSSASTFPSQAPVIARQRVITGGFLFQNMFAFKDRYFLTVGARVDGNSAFGENLGLQTYPKASASYVISDEPFWPGALGTMKLRAAYGLAGRAPGAFDAIKTWTPTLWTGGGGTAFIPRNPGNPDLAPERSREIEVGADAAVLNERLTVDFSYYDRVTSDALLQIARAPSLGNTNQQLENVGKFYNKGVELGVTGKILESAKLGIELNATLATNKSKVLEVGTATVNNVQVGQPAPVVRATKVKNMYDFVDPVFEPDSNNFYGPNLPTQTITLAPTFRFPKQVTLTLRGEYQAGHWITQGAAHFLAQRGPYGTPSCDEVYRYVPWAEYDGPPVYGPSARINTHQNIDKVNAVDRARCYRSILQSNLFTWPADFFKVREITLQAPLPFRLPRMQTAMITISGRNLFTKVSKRNRSNDPDIGNSVENLTFSFTDAVPAPAEFTVSIRATF
ncbi:MAG: TonB-dependent receptor [Gemmatimonadetes bacterium]|nr:TonB-dependent receptor [Gemmatimonadota bacterium]